MKREINIRLVGIAILTIFATIISITIVYYGIFTSQVRADLEVSAKLLKDTHYFESVYSDTDKIDLSADISELRVTWIDESGNVLYDNDANADRLENHNDRPEIQNAFDRGVGESVRMSDTMNKNTFYYAVLLNNGTVLRVATDAVSIWSFFATSAPMIALIALVLIVICIVLSHLLTRQLINPIETMVNNLENRNFKAPYKELEPFAKMIRAQHADILSAAKVRQDFTANVSHELKTPLTAISGYAELLENDMVPADNAKHIYEEIHRNSDRLLALINDIIRLSELDRSEIKSGFTELDLNATAAECMETLSVAADQQNISLTYDGEPCMIHGNPDMIKEVVENLVQNAIRYNNPGGKVTVIVKMGEGPMLIVRDNGIGIPASEQQRIFERFYRVDKSRSKASGGTGLGLAIVKHIADLHGATIDLDSAPGIGTTVTIKF